MRTNILRQDASFRIDLFSLKTMRITQIAPCTDFYKNGRLDWQEAEQTSGSNLKIKYSNYQHYNKPLPTPGQLDLDFTRTTREVIVWESGQETFNGIEKLMTELPEPLPADVLAEMVVLNLNWGDVENFAKPFTKPFQSLTEKIKSGLSDAGKRFFDFAKQAIDAVPSVLSGPMSAVSGFSWGELVDGINRSIPKPGNLIEMLSYDPHPIVAGIGVDLEVGEFIGDPNLRLPTVPDAGDFAQWGENRAAAFGGAVSKGVLAVQNAAGQLLDAAVEKLAIIDKALVNLDKQRVDILKPVDDLLVAIDKGRLAVTGDGKIVAYDVTTSGTLSLDYLTNGYYADVNLPMGLKLDTAAFQDWVNGKRTLPSVNPVELYSFYVSGGLVQSQVSSNYYQIRDELQKSSSVPFYFSSERIAEWLSAEAQSSAILTSIYGNSEQYLSELKRQASLEFGRFMSWLKVNGIPPEVIIAGALKNPRLAAEVATLFLSPLLGAAGPGVAASLASWIAKPIVPRGISMSDGKWTTNRLLTQDPYALFSDSYMRSLVGLQQTGEGTADLRDAMTQLLQDPTHASDALLSRIALIRGRSVADIKSEYNTFLEIRTQRDALAKENIERLWNEHQDFMGTTAQLRYGKVVGDAFGIDAVFGSALNPTGGLVGPGNRAFDSSVQFLSYHGCVHDAAGYLYNYHNVGPGYNYLGLEQVDASNPLAGQVSGIAYWVQVLSKLDMSLNPGSILKYKYSDNLSTPLGSTELGIAEIPHASFGLSYTGAHSSDPYRSVLNNERRGFDLEVLAQPDAIAGKALAGALGGYAVTDLLFGSALGPVLDKIGKSDWANAVDGNLKAGVTGAAVDGAVFGSLARTFGVTNADVLKALPADGKPAPAVVSLMGTEIEGRVQAFLNKLAQGNEGKAEIKRLEFDISTYELNIEYNLHNRHVWNTVEDLKSVISQRV